jgi:phosphatidylinositol alpha-1,6-mannosyltransferase
MTKSSRTRASAPPRVLFVSHTFPPPDRPLSSVGGMQRVATDLHHALAQHPGVRVRADVLRTSWRWIYLRTPPYLARLYSHIDRLARRGEIDVILFSSVISAGIIGFPLQRTLRACGVRTVAVTHGDDVTCSFPHFQYRLRRTFDALDAVVSVSRATGQACLDRGLSPDKLHVIPNGIRTDRFEVPVDDGIPRRDRLAPLAPLPADDDFLLCSVGRQVPRKGFAWFVDEVMPSLPGSVHYWLAGSGPEGSNIQTAAARRGLQDRVRLLGSVSDDHLGGLYSGSDLFIMPNIAVPGTMEGFGIVMLEAGLCGLPTIAARLEGIQDVIAESENGHLVTSGCADSFRRAILPYVENRGRLQDVRRRARERTRRFSWPVIADVYVQLLRDLAARPVSPVPVTPSPRPAIGGLPAIAAAPA